MQNLLKQKEKSRKRRQSIFSSSEFQEIERKRKKKQTAQKRKRKSLSLSKVSSSDSTTASYSKLETSASLKDSRWYYKGKCSNGASPPVWQSMPIIMLISTLLTRMLRVVYILRVQAQLILGIR